MGEDKINETIELDLPKIRTKEIWLQLQFNLYLKLANIIDSMDDETDSRLWYITTLIINTVPSEEQRTGLLDQRRERTEELLKEYDNPDNKDRAVARNKACMEVVGGITSYLDQSIGLEEKMVVGTP